MRVRVCEVCNSRTMVREVTLGEVRFRCPCGHEKLGEGEDRLIDSGGDMKSGGAAQGGELMRMAPHSQAMLRVARDCKKCGLDYMTMVVMGEDRAVSWACTCGLVEQN